MCWQHMCQHYRVTPTHVHLLCLQAFPDTLELRPNSSATIRLAFRPRDGQYYVQSLLLMAVLKSQRSFRLVGEGQAVVPPWCIGLLVRVSIAFFACLSR
jgi:hypothetical protein